jgi:hypothetical protein
VEINVLHDLVESRSPQDWDLFVFLELEGGLLPNFLDGVKFRLNFGFFGSSINNLVNFL